MSRLPAWFRAFTRVSYNYTDPYDLQRARGLTSIALGGLFVVILSAAFVPFSQFSAALIAQTLVSLALFALVLLGVPVLINRGQLILASLLYILLSFVATLIFFVAAPNDAILLSFTVPVIAAGVLLNRRGMIVMFALVLGAILVIWALVRLNALPPAAPIFSSPLAGLETIIPSLLIDAIMLIIFAGGQRAMQRRNLALALELRNSAQITQAIAGIQSIEELLARAVELIRENLNFDHVRIFLLEEKSHLLVLHAGTAVAGGLKSIGQRRITPDDSTVINEAVRTRKTLRISMEDSGPRRAELLSAMHTQLLIPLRREDRTLGVLDIQSMNPDAFMGDDTEVLESIASQLTIALENARLYSQLQTTTQERQQLAALVREASRQIEQLTLEVTGRAWSRYLESRGESTIGYDWAKGGTTAQTAMSTGLQRALNNAMPELYVEDGEQVLCVPIISRGQPLGAMEFRAPAERVWNSRSIELVRVISQRLALALDNLRLFEQAQVVANREQIASEVAANLQTKTDVDSLVALAAEAFQEALGATRTSIRLGKPNLAQPEQPHQNPGKNGSHS